MKKRSYSRHHRNRKDHKRLLQATICQWNGTPWRNEKKKSRKIHSSIEKNREYSWTNHKYWNWNCDLKTSKNKSLRPDGVTGEFYQTF